MRKVLLPAILFLLINVLFVDKYTMRITEWHYLCDALFLLFGGGLVWLTTWLQKREGPYGLLLSISAALYILVLAGVQYSIDPFSLQVDRWSAIHNFLDNLFHGVFPYAAQTHLGGYGSPFPVWQILHIPFYFVGNVGLSFFVVLAFFLFTLSRCESTRTAFIAFIWILCAPAIHYEVLTRSDLFTNLMLVCALCEWLRYKQVQIEDHTYFIALLAGLLASTRLAAVIPLAFLYGYAFLQMKIWKQIGFVLVVLAVFVLTFLPFICWDAKQLLFFEYNPFVLQTRQGSPITLLLFLLIAVAWTIYNKNNTQHFALYVALLLNLLVVITFGYNMITSGNYALFSSKYDITYFDMALPFYLCAIAKPFTP